jgi:hypothetical protein
MRMEAFNAVTHEKERIKGSKNKFHIDQSLIDQFDRVPKKGVTAQKEKSRLYT